MATEGIAGTAVWLDGIEIINDARTQSYIRNRLGPPGLSIMCDIGCPNMVQLIGCDSPSGYVSPTFDNAPWLSSSFPESSDFLGVLVSDFSGLSSTLTRNVTPIISEGAVLGRLRAKERTLQWKVYLIGRTCCSVAYGLRWLTRQLSGPNACTGTCTNQTLDLITCCPETFDSNPNDDPGNSVTGVIGGGYAGDGYAQDPYAGPDGQEPAGPGTHTVADGLVLPGTSGNYVDTPDSAPLSITGDITVIARVLATDWTPGTASDIVAKWTSAGNQRSYRLRINTTGALIFSHTGDGSTIVDVLSTNPAFVDGSDHWIKAERTSASGSVSFFQGTDGVNWTLISTNAGTAGAIFDSTAPLEIGSQDAGTANLLAGTVRFVDVRSGIGPGTRQANPDFSTGPWQSGDTSPTARADAQGNTYTIHGTASIQGQTVPNSVSVTETDVIFPPKESVNNNAFRTLYNVGLTEGPVITEHQRVGCGCGGAEVMQVEFTLVASKPYLYQDSIVIQNNLPLSFGVATSSPELADCGQATCAINPACPPPVTPPLPVLTNNCYVAPITPTATRISVPRSYWPDLTDVVPIITIYSGSQALKSTTLDFYTTASGDPCGEIVSLGAFPCNPACGTLKIPYIPGDSTFVIDGRINKMTVICPFRTAIQPGEKLTSGEWGWPSFSCYGFCFELITDQSVLNSTATVTFELVPRSL